MGAWGTKPTDNDSYFDTYAVTIGKAIVAIDKIAAKKETPRRAHYDGNEWRAAAVFVRKLAAADLYRDDALLAAHCDALLAKLRVLHDDDDWAEEWNSPAEICRELKKEIAALDALLQTTVKKLKRGKGSMGDGIAGRVQAIMSSMPKRPRKEAS